MPPKSSEDFVLFSCEENTAPDNPGTLEFS